MKIISSEFRYIFVVAVIGIFVSASSAQAPLVQDEKDELIDNSRNIRKQLRQMSTTSIPTPQTSEAKTQLGQLIDKVQELKLPKAKQATADEVKLHGPASQVSIAQQSVSIPSTQTTGASKDRQKDNTQAIVNALMDTPEDIVNPLFVAESLFVSSKLEDAGRFYQLALRRIEDNKDDPDRSWILFQAANCIRHSDPDGAYKIYEELISKCPDSLWTPAARSQQQIISWSRENDTKIIMEKYVSDPNIF